MKKIVNLVLGLSCAVVGGVGLTFIPEAKEKEVAYADGVSLTAVDGVYQIGTANDLAILSAKIASGETGYDTATYKLTGNIDLGGKIWTPIGSSSHPFKGVFNGNGYTISNRLTVSNAAVGDYFGLFGYVDGAAIYDIVLGNSYDWTGTSSSTYVGSLIGYAKNSFIGGIADNSTLDENTIGTIAGSMKLYYGGYGLTGSATVDTPFDYKTDSTSSLEEGNLIVFDARTTDPAFIEADGKIYGDRYLVPISGVTAKTYNYNNFGSTFPTQVYQVGHIGSWVTGTGSYSGNNLFAGAIADNNYVLTAVFTPGTTNNVEIYVYEEGVPTALTTLSVPYGTLWEDIIVNNVLDIEDGYGEARDFLSAKYGEEVIYGPVTVTYTSGGTRTITNGVVSGTNEKYLEELMSKGRVSYSGISSLDLITTWQKKKVNSQVVFSHTNGGNIKASAGFAHSLIYSADSENVSIANDGKYTVWGGTSVKYSLTIPTGYSVKITDCPTGYSIEGTSNDGYYTGALILSIPSGFAKNTEYIGIEVKRIPYTINVIGYNNLATINFSDSTGYSSYSAGAITTYIDEKFTATLIAADGLRIKNVTISDITPTATETTIVNYDDMKIVFPQLTGFGDNPTISVVSISKEFYINFDYEMGDTPVVSSNEYVEMTVKSGTAKTYLYSSSERNSAYQLSMNNDGSLEVKAGSKNKYYQVTKVKIGTNLSSMETKTIDLSTSKYVFEHFDDYLFTEGVSTVYVRAILDPAKYIVQASFAQIKDIDGSDRDVELTDAYIIKEGSHVLTITDEPISIGSVIKYSTDIVSKYYELDGWYLVKDGVETLIPNFQTSGYTITETNVSDVILKVKLKPKEIKITVNLSKTIIKDYNGTTDKYALDEQDFTTDDSLTINYTYGNDSVVLPTLTANAPYTLVGLGTYSGSDDNLSNVKHGEYSTNVKDFFGVASEAELTAKYFSSSFSNMEMYPVATQRVYTINFKDTDVDGNYGTITYQPDTTSFTHYYQSATLRNYVSNGFDKIYLTSNTPNAKLNKTTYKGFIIKSDVVDVKIGSDTIEEGISTGKDGLDVLLKRYKDSSETVVNVYPVVERVLYTITFKYKDQSEVEQTKEIKVNCFNGNFTNDKSYFKLLSQDDLENYHKGYTLLGWQIASTVSDSESNFVNDKVFSLSEDYIEYTLEENITFTAVDEAKKINITFNSNMKAEDGSVASSLNNETDYSKTFNNALTNAATWFEGTTFANSRPGYDLIGWVVTSGTVKYSGLNTVIDGGYTYGFYTNGNKSNFTTRTGLDESLCYIFDTTTKFNGLDNFVDNDVDKLYAYAIWKLNETSVKSKNYISFEQNVISYINSSSFPSGLAKVTVKKQSFPTDIWTNSVYGKFIANTLSASSGSVVYTKVYINDVLNSIVCNSDRGLGCTERLQFVLGADYEFACQKGIGTYETFADKLDVILKNFELVDALYTLKFEMITTDIPVETSAGLQTEGSVYWYDNTTCTKIQEIELNVTGVSLEAKSNKDDNIKAGSSNITKYIDSLNYSKRLLEYTTIKSYMDSAAEFFKNNATYDEEGFFTNYSKDWTLVDIVNALANKDLFGYDYYRAYNDSEVLRTIDMTSKFGAGLDSVLTSSRGEEYLLRAMTDSEFSYLKYLGYKSLIALMNISPEFKAEMVDFITKANKSGAIDLLSLDLEDISNYSEYLYEVYQGESGSMATLHIVGFTDLVERESTSVNVIVKYTDGVVKYYVDDTNVSLSIGNASGYKTITIGTTTYYITYMYTNFGENSFVDYIFSGNMDSIIKNIATLWELNSNGLSIDELLIGTISQVGISEVYTISAVSAKDVEVGVYSGLIWKLKFASTMNNTTFKNNVDLASCYQIGNIDYFVLNAVEMFNSYNNSSYNNSYNTLNLLYKAPYIEFITLDDNNVIAVEDLEFERTISIDLDKNGTQENVVLGFDYDISEGTYTLMIKFPGESTFTSQINGYYRWNNKDYVFAIANNIVVTPYSDYDKQTISTRVITETSDVTSFNVAIINDIGVEITGLVVTGYDNVVLSNSELVNEVYVISIYGINAGSRTFLGTIVSNGTNSVTIYTIDEVSGYNYTLINDATNGGKWINKSDDTEISTIETMIKDFDTEIALEDSITKTEIDEEKYFILSRVINVEVSNGFFEDRYPKGTEITEDYYISYSDLHNGYYDLTSKLSSIFDSDIWEVKGFSFNGTTTSADVDASVDRKTIKVKSFKKISLKASWAMISSELNITIDSAETTTFTASLTGTEIFAADYIASVEGFDLADCDIVWVVNGVKSPSIILYGDKESATYTINVSISDIRVSTNVTVDITVNPITLTVSSMFVDATYDATDKIINYKDFVKFNEDAITLEDAEDNLTMKFYSDDTCLTEVGSLLNAGTYYAKFNYDNPTHRIYSIDTTTIYTINIAKLAEEINYSDIINKVGFTKHVSQEDPAEITAGYRTSLNELISLTFARVSEETPNACGKHELVLSGVYDNYEFTLVGFEEAFDIRSGEGELVICLSSTEYLEKVYNGANTTLSFIYDASAWVITGGKANISGLSYKVWNTGTSSYDTIAVGSGLLSGLTIKADEAINNAGRYVLSMEIKDNAAGDAFRAAYPNGAVFEGPTYFTVKQKELTLTTDKLTKEFDMTTDGSWTFTSTDGVGVIAGDTVVVSGTFETIEITSDPVNILGLTCDNDNYKVKTTGVKGRIVKNSSWEISLDKEETRVVFGTIQETNKKDLSNYGIDLVNELDASVKDFITIKSVNISGESYAEGYLIASATPYSVTLTLESKYFTVSTLNFLLYIDKADLNITISNASKYYDGTVNANSSALTTSIITGYVGTVAISSIKFNDSIVKKYYVEDLIVEISGETKDNYNLIISLSADYFEIKSVIVRLNLNHSAFTFVSDGLSVEGTNPVDITYNQNNTIEVEVSRVGYTFAGWSSTNDLEASKITNLEEYVKGLIEIDNNSISVIGPDSVFEVTLYSRWTIKQYNVTLEFNDSSKVTSAEINGTETLSIGVDYYNPVAFDITLINNCVINHATLNGNAIEINPFVIEHITENSLVEVNVRWVIVKITKVIGTEEISVEIAYNELGGYDLSEGVAITGYIITGWKTADTEEVVTNVKDTIDSCTSGNVTDRQEFKFKPVLEGQTYSVTFYKSTDSSEYVVKNIKCGELLSTVEHGFVDETGSTMLRYWTTKDGSISFNTDDPYEYTDTESLFLYGVWAPVECELTIVFNDNGNTGCGFSLYADSSMVGDIAGVYTISLTKHYKISITRPEGYIFNCMTSGDVDITTTEDEIIINEINGDATITINIVARLNKITIKATNVIVNTNVKVDGVDAVFLKDGDDYVLTAMTGKDVIFEVTAMAGYNLDLTGYTLEDGKIKISNVTKNITYTFVGTANGVKASFEFGANGIESITVNGEVKTEAGFVSTQTGAQLSISVTLKSGYEESEITITSGSATVTENGLNRFIISDYTEDFTFWVTCGAVDCNIEVRLIAIDDENLIINAMTNNAIIVNTLDENITTEESSINNIIIRTGVAEFNADAIAKASVAEGFVFLGWYKGINYSVDNTKITFFGELLSEESLYNIKITPSTKLIAVFRYKEYDLNVQAEGHGKVKLGEVVNQTDYTTKVSHGKVYTIEAQPEKGYKLSEWQYIVDDVPTTLSDAMSCAEFEVVGIDETTKALQIKFYANAIIKAVYVEKESSISVNAVMLINDIEVDNLDGGKFTRIAVGTYDEKNGFVADGTATRTKEISYLTGETKYFRVEVYEGFEFRDLQNVAEDGKIPAISTLISSDETGTTKYYIFALINLNADDVYDTIKIRVDAQTINISLQFVDEEIYNAAEDKTTVRGVDAGRILINNAFGTQVTGNYSSTVMVNAIAGTSFSVEVYTRFGFTILSSNAIIKPSEIYVDGYTYSNVTDTTTGFTTSALFTLKQYSAEMNVIYILVSSKTYKIELYDENTRIAGTSTIENVKYGDMIDISAYREVLTNYINSREGYEFNGFYTSQNATGTKYIDKDLNVTQTWSENGYIWNGAKYITAKNYNETTQTFILYISWGRLKSTVEIKVSPEGIKNLPPTVGAQVVLTCLTDSNSWINIEDEFSVDILYGADISIKAPTYANYNFKSWTIYLDGVALDEITSATYTKVNGFNCKSVIIKANYTVEVGLSSLEGGVATISQGASVINSNETMFVDPEQSITLTAVANIGYSFTGWYNKDTNELISEDLIYVIEPGESGLKAINIEARFTGNDVIVKIDSTYNKTYGEITTIKLNGVVIEYNSFDAVVGDKLKLYITKTEAATEDTGIKWNLKGISYAGEEYDFTTRVRYLTYNYKLAGEDVVDGVITIKPQFTEQYFSAVLDIKLNETLNYEKAGSVESENTIENNTISLHYGRSLNIKVIAKENYKVQSVKVNDIDVMSFAEDGQTITIGSEVFAIYYLADRDITIHVVFTEDRWIDSVGEMGLRGEGIANNPYLIYTAEELAFIAYKVNVLNDKAFANAHYRIMSDISMAGKFWNPIGTAKTQFNGTFNFNDFSVFDITQEKEEDEENSIFNGVFGLVTESAVIIWGDNSKLIIILSTTIPCGCVGAGLATFFTIRKRRKKLHERLSNN